MVLCSKCGGNVSYNQRFCAVCNTDAGFPNVRLAQRAEEVQALNARYSTAYEAAKARGVTAELKLFETAVRQSKAVMSRSLGAICEWLNGASPLFQSFHKQVDSHGRVPNETAWDEQREAAESTINPFCYKELVIAALSLDGIGMRYYGDYYINFKSITIEDRSSVFEKNPFYFNVEHNIISGRSPPFGFRASWNNKEKLAAAKLHPKITAGMTEGDFPEILLEARRTESNCDFVEVHIYGDVNREGIERIIGPRPTTRQDKAIWKQAVRKAKGLGASVEESG